LEGKKQGQKKIVFVTGLNTRGETQKKENERST